MSEEEAVKSGLDTMRKAGVKMNPIEEDILQTTLAIAWNKGTIYGALELTRRVVTLQPQAE